MLYRRAGWAIAAIAGVSGVMFACSSPGPLYPAVSDFCTAYAKATCQESTNCSTSVTACVTEQTSICETTSGSAEDGNRTYVPNNAPPCVNLAETTYASATVTFAQTSALLTACANVFAGGVALGSPCTTTYDCANAASGIICDGVCVAQSTPIAVSATGFCSNPGDVCVSGAYCNESASHPVCTVDAAEGAPCSATVPCGTSLRCLGTPGTCQLRAIQGAGKGSCATNADCDPSVPYCDPFDGFICTTGLIFSPAETALCQDFGGGTATPFDAGAPPVIAIDSGAAGDSGGGD